MWNDESSEPIKKEKNNSSTKRHPNPFNIA